MLKPKYIVVHTAAYTGRNCDRDIIDQWHRQRGWDGIGYHFVIINERHDSLEDGLVQLGRDLNKNGAHARGLNSQSIGICCVGHGDKTAFTPAQKSSLFRLVSRLIDEYDDITVKEVIGHRELNLLINNGVIHSRFRVNKTCPGKKVDMDELRRELSIFRESLNQPVLTAHEDEATTISEKELLNALNVLERARPGFSNAGQAITEVLTHPEVIEFRTGLPDDGADDYQEKLSPESRLNVRPDSISGNGRPNSGGNGRPISGRERRPD